MGNKSGKSDNYISTSEAARLLGLSVGTVQNMVEQGQLSAWKTTGGHRRILRSSVEQFIAFKPSSEALASLTNANSPSDLDQKRTGPFRLLVAEDSDVTLQVYESIISKLQHPLEVIYVKDGIQAMLQLGDNNYDMLLLDLQIPFVNGYQMLENIRKKAALKSLHILIVTSSPESEVRKHKQITDDLTVLTKPIKHEFLFGYLSGVIASYQRP